MMGGRTPLLACRQMGMMLTSAAAGVGKLCSTLVVEPQKLC